MSETLTGTAQEIAEKLGSDYQSTLGFIKFLVQRGVAHESGVRPNSSGRGKAAKVYTVPRAVSVVL